jgi:hypothetical protein
MGEAMACLTNHDTAGADSIDLVAAAFRLKSRA